MQPKEVSAGLSESPRDKTGCQQGSESPGNGPAFLACPCSVLIWDYLMGSMALVQRGRWMQLGPVQFLCGYILTPHHNYFLKISNIVQDSGIYFI